MLDKASLLSGATFSVLVRVQSPSIKQRAGRSVHFSWAPYTLFSQKVQIQNHILVRGVLCFTSNQNIIYILEQSSLI